MEIPLGKREEKRAKVNMLKEKYGAKLEFPEGWRGGGGMQTQTPSMGGVVMVVNFNIANINISLMR